MLVAALVLLLAMIGISVPVAIALGVLGLALDQFFSLMPLQRALGEVVWQNSTEFLLVAVPLFILLGELMLRTGIARNMYGALVQWLSWLPGGLMHSNVGSCALFAATSGSSVATAATVGTLAMPEAKKRGYNERLFLGTIAAGGTLGILIPPSVNLIVYGLLSGTSVPKLYLAGLVPGVLLASLFMLAIVLACLFRVSWGGMPVSTTWRERQRTLPDLLPPMGIFLLVIGPIYLGWATPTEAASFGVVGALILAAMRRSLTIEVMRRAIEGTLQTTAMIMLIVLAAVFLNFVLGAIGATRALTDLIDNLGFAPIYTLLAIIAFYIILGCFMEVFAMMITTTPLIVPIVVGLGYDPVWFGILLMILLETALITPPIGLNLYVVQAIREHGSVQDVVVGSIPFLAVMLMMIGLLILFPGLALWLPSQIG